MPMTPLCFPLCPVLKQARGDSAQRWSLAMLSFRGGPGGSGRCFQRLVGFQRPDYVKAEQSRWRPKASHWRALHGGGGGGGRLNHMRCNPNISSVSSCTFYHPLSTQSFLFWRLVEELDRFSPSSATLQTWGSRASTLAGFLWSGALWLPSQPLQC